MIKEYLTSLPLYLYESMPYGVEDQFLASLQLAHRSMLGETLSSLERH